MSDAKPSEAGAPQGGVGREIELKLALPPGALAALRRDPRLRALAAGPPTERRLRTVYYDTAERDLARAGLALRVRTCEGAHVQALKSERGSQAGLFVRGEWEAAVPTAVPDLARIPDAAVRARAEAAARGRPLAAVFETDFVRTELRVERAGAAIALALDEGELRAGRAARPICEVELELLRGAPRALYELARALHEIAPLRPAALSKAARGYALAAGTAPGVRRARPPALAPGATLDEAAGGVLSACLEHVLASLDPAREDERPEPARAGDGDGVDPRAGAAPDPARAGEGADGVEPLRVALRRLRAALALFRPALAGAEARALRAGLRRLAHRLGPARELDVLLAEALDPREAPADAGPGLATLRAAARALRDEAYAEVRAGVEAPETSARLLALGAWIAGRGWRQEAGAEALALLGARARDFAEPRLDRRLRAALARGRALARLGPAARRRLRLRLKLFRDAAEFLQGVLPERSLERASSALSWLDDALGRSDDVAAMERHLERIAERLGPAFGPAERIAAGWAAGRAAARAERGRAELGRAWRTFERAAAAWSRP